MSKQVYSGKYFLISMQIIGLLCRYIWDYFRFISLEWLLQNLKSLVSLTDKCATRSCIKTFERTHRLKRQKACQGNNMIFILAHCCTLHRHRAWHRPLVPIAYPHPIQDSRWNETRGNDTKEESPFTVLTYLSCGHVWQLNCPLFNNACQSNRRQGERPSCLQDAGREVVPRCTLIGYPLQEVCSFAK